MRSAPGLLLRPVVDLGRRFRSVDGFVGQAVSAGVEVAEEIAGEVEGVVEGVVGGGAHVVEDSLGLDRRVWEDPDHHHAQIELWPVQEPTAPQLWARLKQSLEQVQAVQWAEVNAVTGRVAVAFDGRATPLNALVKIVEGTEQAYGVRRGRLAERRRAAKWDLTERADHPADVEPVQRALALLAGDVVGLGVSVAVSLARLPGIPIEVGSLFTLVESQPRLRRQVERVVGRGAAGLFLPLASAVANGLAQGPSGILVDVLYRSCVISELQARRLAWARREPEFYAHPSNRPIEPPALEPRPRPLPDGPVEKSVERVSLASLGGFAVALGVTRSPRRAADAFLAGLPRTARLGREGFATQLGRVLARRGVVPLDGSALRRLDRVDTVVIDSDVLVTGRVVVDEVRPFGELPPDQLRARAESLLARLAEPAPPPRGAETSDSPPAPQAAADAPHAPAAAEAPGAADAPGEADAGGVPHAPGRLAEDGEWTLRPAQPPDDGQPWPRGARTRARELRRDGAMVFALHQHDRLQALVRAIPELEAGAVPLVSSIRHAGHRLVVAGHRGRVGSLVGADVVIHRGKRMGPAIRALQADGAVVVAIGRRGKRGLGAADVGIGLTRPSGRPPWGADLLCGHELADAAFVVDATVVAAAVSRRSAWLAMVGSGVAAVAAITGSPITAGRRALAIVNGATVISLAAGTWSGIDLGRRPSPEVTVPTAFRALGPGPPPPGEGREEVDQGGPRPTYQP